MHPQAVLLAAAPSLSLVDYNTGTLLAAWKPASAAAHCTAVAATRNGLGGLILSVQPDKPLLHAFAFQKDQMLHKMVLPEKLTALALDAAAAYCAGGTQTGRIYLWEVASGLLLNTFDAHYRQVTVLRFSPDGAALFTGSEDSGIAVWSLSRLLDNATQNDAPPPYATFTDHTLAISDLACGVGSFPAYRLFSSSLDGSVKMWDVAARELLGTFAFPAPLAHLAVDPAERAIYAAAAGDRGVVYQIDLYARAHGHGYAARAAVGAGATLHMGAEGEQAGERARLFTVGKPVTALALDLPGTQLLAGGADGGLSIFDVASHQLLRTVAIPGGPVTFVQTLLRPPDLVGPASSSTLPQRPLAVFHRIRDRGAREAHEVPLVLPRSPPVPPAYTPAAVLRDHAAFVRQQQQQQHKDEDKDKDAGALVAEVARLKEQLAQAKGINDAMWEAAVHAALVPADGTTGGQGKSAKRPRVAQ